MEKEEQFEILLRVLRRFQEAGVLKDLMLIGSWRLKFYPAPQKAPSVKTGMNGKRLPEGFFPKATGVNPWCGVYRYQRPLASWNFYGTIPGKWTKSEVS